MCDQAGTDRQKLLTAPLSVDIPPNNRIKPENSADNSLIHQKYFPFHFLPLSKINVKYNTI